MARRRSRHRAKSEMNVVPYIDVMLVLLVIFMISAPLLNQSVEVTLPQSDNSEEVVDEGEAKAPFIVSIDKSGSYYIDSSGDEPLPVTKDAVIEIASDKLADNPELSVYIRADKEVNYGYVMTIMDMLKTTGAKSVGLITDAE